MFIQDNFAGQYIKNWSESNPIYPEAFSPVVPKFNQRKILPKTWIECHFMILCAELIEQNFIYWNNFWAKLLYGDTLFFLFSQSIMCFQANCFSRLNMTCINEIRTLFKLSALDLCWYSQCFHNRHVDSPLY